MAVATPRAGDRWRAFVAAFAGWMLDGYDFTIVTLVLVDIQRDLSIGAAAAGALGTITLLTRLAGAVVAGRAADRWGRKWPLLISIVWFSVFSFLSGFSHSYAMLFALRAMFGLGMGGEWAAGMSLVLEHWPERQRGLVTGGLQGAFSWGFILAALMFHIVYRQFDAGSLGWRVLFWTGLPPAALVLWMRRRVPESPLWLAGRSDANRGQGRHASRWNRGLRSQVARTTVVLGALMFAYQSMSFWYASLLRQTGRAPLAYLVALNLGGIVGATLWGALGDTRLGRPGAISVASGATVMVLPLFLYAHTPSHLWLGALLTGFSGAGIIGVAPAYVGGQFPAAFRGTGSALVYHAAAVIGAVAPYVLGMLQDAAWPLRGAMTVSISAASVVAVTVVWSGPGLRTTILTETPLNSEPTRGADGS
jgi:SHS family lactate transporter-like MFS transporter